MSCSAPGRGPPPSRRAERARQDSRPALSAAERAARRARRRHGAGTLASGPTRAGRRPRPTAASRRAAASCSSRPAASAADSRRASTACASSAEAACVRGLDRRADRALLRGGSSAGTSFGRDVGLSARRRRRVHRAAMQPRDGSPRSLAAAESHCDTSRVGPRAIARRRADVPRRIRDAGRLGAPLEADRDAVGLRGTYAEMRVEHRRHRSRSATTKRPARLRGRRADADRSTSRATSLAPARVARAAARVRRLPFLTGMRASRVGRDSRRRCRLTRRDGAHQRTSCHSITP